MNAVEVVQEGGAIVEIIQEEQVVLEITLAAVGPPGPKGEAIDLLPIVGDPNTDFAQLYSIFKL